MSSWCTWRCTMCCTWTGTLEDHAQQESVMFMYIFMGLVENMWKRHICQLFQFADMSAVSQDCLSDIPTVAVSCAPAECLGSKRGIMSVSGRHSQNIFKCLFDLHIIPLVCITPESYQKNNLSLSLYALLLDMGLIFFQKNKNLGHA